MYCITPWSTVDMISGWRMGLDDAVEINIIVRECLL